MKKQVKKLVVLLGVAGTFVLMSFNEPRWFAGIYDVKCIVQTMAVLLSLIIIWNGMLITGIASVIQGGLVICVSLWRKICK